jgi:hypothetical protein
MSGTNAWNSLNNHLHIYNYLIELISLFSNKMYGYSLLLIDQHLVLTANFQEYGLLLSAFIQSEKEENWPCVIISYA